MKIKKNAAEKVFSVFNSSFLLFLMVAAAYPVIYVMFSSISDPVSLLTYRGILLMPQGLSFDAYKAVFENPNILEGYKNTLIYVIGGTVINVFLTILGAYGLSRKRLLSRNIIMMGITFTMLFSGGLIPTYLLVDQLHMLNTRWALMIPNAISAYNLIIMRTSFQSIPDSLEESARMDGANDFIILFKIFVPLSTAVIAVMILFYSVSHWNSWFNASIYLRNRTLYPLQLFLREILIQNNTDSMTIGTSASDKISIGETIKYATIVVSIIPILAVYPMLQKYFIKGVMIGAIKG